MTFHELHTWPAAKAAAVPPEDPPAVSLVSQGFRVLPYTLQCMCILSDHVQSTVLLIVASAV